MKDQAAKLIQALDQLVTVYRHLLDVVRKEQEVLTEAKLDDLTELNKSKEKMVAKIKQLEIQWLELAQQLAVELKLQKTQPTLRELAETIGGEQSERLHNLRSVLNMLVNRIAEINKKNEALVQSALAHITGAMRAITDTLKENPTYRKGGGMRGDVDGTSGRLITKEI